MLTASLLLLHLVSFAAFVGAGFAQLQLMKASTREGLAAGVRDAYERLSATIVTKIELPAIFGSMVSGMFFIVQSPVFMKQGWLHGKLTCVLILAILSHLEMFNARAIVRLREEGGAGVEDEIRRRKIRHNTLGTIGTLAIVALLILLTYVRLGAFRS